MNKTPVTLNPAHFPQQLSKYFDGGEVFDASCSNRAKTYYLPKGSGYYLKIGQCGSLEKQAQLSEYFAKKGFGAAVLEYFSFGESDYMVTAEVKGVDGTHETILAEPERFCDIFSASLRALHEANCSDCPVSGVTSALIPEAHSKYESGTFDAWMLGYADISSPEEGYALLCKTAHLLKEDTHIHGDACLPNIIIDDWKFSGFIDFEGGGMGDRHFDLLWAIWSLEFNLKTKKLKERFLDGYGRDAFDLDRLKLCTAIQSFSY